MTGGSTDPTAGAAVGGVVRAVDPLTAVAERLAAGGVLVLSGAGLSTESGIPDYRGPSGAARRHTPMTFQAFTGDAEARQRYWARSHVGWRMVARAEPNAGHLAVARLQRAGLVTDVITQNVDGLHQAGGATSVVELHGSLDRVVCLACGDRTPRGDLDRRLRALNPGFDAPARAVNPDGDVELPQPLVDRFQVAECRRCGDGILKPDVVFFGENVPADRVQRCFALVAAARSLLVLGSSLTVMSGRRFVIRAAKRGVPISIVNQGPTRGDEHADVRVDAALGATLAALVDRVAPEAPPARQLGVA